jgi:hypothetical protein
MNSSLHHTILACPNCRENLTLYAWPNSQYMGCGKCYSLLKIAPNDLVLQHRFQRSAKFTISPGTEVNIENIKYIVISATLKGVQNSSVYYWSEYLLYHPSHPIASLSETNGHWHYLVRHTGAIQNTKYVATFQNREYDIYNRDKVVTHNVVGELPDSSFENCSYEEYISPPYILSHEIYSNNESWFFGKYVTQKELKEAVPTLTSTPVKWGVGAAQPNAVKFPINLVWYSFLAFATIMLLSAMLLWKRETTLGQMTLEVPSTQPITQQVSPAAFLGMSDSAFAALDIDQSNAAVSSFNENQIKKDEYAKTFSFEVPSNHSALGVKLHATPSNSWVSCEVILINENTGEEKSFWQDIEYYSGYDGGSWSEGSFDESRIVSNVKAGKYHFLIKGQQAAAQDAKPVNITWTINPPIYSNLWTVLILGLVVVIALNIIRSAFESRRWANASATN